MWWRFSRRPWRIAALLLAGAAAAGAQEGPGSRAQANATIEQARVATAEIERRYEQVRRDCAKAFLVNSCLESARRERDQQLRTVREREVAARDELRRLDAEERAKAREQRSAEKAGEPGKGAGSAAAADKSVKAGSARQPSPPRTVDTQQQEAAAKKKQVEAAQRRAGTEQRTAEQAGERERRDGERAMRDAQAPAAAAQYEQRQRDAQARAEEKTKAAEENRKRRERRAQERAASEKAGQAKSGN